MIACSGPKSLPKPAQRPTDVAGDRPGGLRTHDMGIQLDKRAAGGGGAARGEPYGGVYKGGIDDKSCKWIRG